MGDRFADWQRHRRQERGQRADRRFEADREPEAPDRRDAAPPRPFAQPPPQPAPLYVPVAVAPPVWTPPRQSSVQTVVLVQDDGHDVWGNFLDRLPDLPVPNYNPEGHDAMAMSSNVHGQWNPDHGKWTETAVSSYGHRDRGAEALERHVPAKYGDSLAKIRNG